MYKAQSTEATMTGSATSSSAARPERTRVQIQIPVRMVERLSAYRRQLRRWVAEGRTRIFSHELGALVGGTPAQVRRDLMTIGYTGSPARGYEATGLIARISELLDAPTRQGIALVGVGYLGRAILNYFGRTHPDLPILAAFDVAPEKIGRVLDGCRCYGMHELEHVLAEQPVTVGILAVPVEAAQGVADRLIQAGVRGLLNFTPTRLRVPPEVYVEDVDIAVSLEKVAFFARHGAGRTEE